MTKSILISTVILFFTCLIETAILSNIMILPVVPDLLLLVALYISLLNGSMAGEITGFISGLFLDFLTGSPFGFNCIFRTLISYIAGWFGKTISFKGVFMPCVFGFLATLLKLLLMWLISLFYPLVEVQNNLISVAFAFELVANTVLSPVVFKIVGAFDRLIGIRE